jgi:hypothetical protein
MARGFESKDVEFQQAEAERRGALRRALTPGEREHAERRHSVELALTRARGDLAAATSPVHRHMLEQGIAELERQLASVVSGQRPVTGSTGRRSPSTAHRE